MFAGPDDACLSHGGQTKTRHGGSKDSSRREYRRSLDLVLVPDSQLLLPWKASTQEASLLNKQKMTCPIRFRRLLVLYDTPENAKRSHSPSFSEGAACKITKKDILAKKEKKDAAYVSKDNPSINTF